jgi:hypothetical protein
MVKITYGHGWVTDCDDPTGPSGTWAKTEDGQTLAALAVVNDDVFDIEATASIGNKLGKYENPTNMGLSSDVYTKCLFRYKCSSGSMLAKIVLTFSDATSQTVLAAISETTWHKGSVTITAAKTIDHVGLFCNGDVGHVYYDFVLICQNEFEFPNAAAHNLRANPRNASLVPPGKVGDHNQNLGSEPAMVMFTCDLSVGTNTLSWKRTLPADTIDGEVFLDISHNAKSEPFQWLEMDDKEFKVVLDDMEFQMIEGKLQLVLTLKEYSRGNANDEYYYERWGTNL